MIRRERVALIQVHGISGMMTATLIRFTRLIASLCQLAVEMTLFLVAYLRPAARRDSVWGKEKGFRSTCCMIDGMLVYYRR